jgi:hypothetical protein
MRAAESAQRRPYIEDLGLVRAALEQAGVPVTEPLLDFHREFAGYTVEVGLDEGVLGLIHREVCVQSLVRPMKVGGYLPDSNGEYFVACADMHASYEMFLHLDGTFDSNGPVASSYFMYTEQLAFAWEFAQGGPVRALPLEDLHTDEEIRAVLVPRLAGHRVDALSDAVSQVFRTEAAVVIVRDSGFHQAWVKMDRASGPDGRPPELQGLKLRGRVKE